MTFVVIVIFIFVLTLPYQYDVARLRTYLRSAICTWVLQAGAT